MDATIEEFGKLYPAYATLYFKDECEIVETAPKSDLDFRRLVVSGGEGYAFPRELAGDSVSFYSKAGCQEPMLLNSDGIFFAEVDGRKCLFCLRTEELLWRCSNQPCQGTDCGNIIALAGSA